MLQRRNKMDWIFSVFLGISLIHMGEEYLYPGGFTDLMKRINPNFAPRITASFAVIMNGLQLLLCLVAIAIGRNNLAFSLSIAGLLFFNGLIHLTASLRVKRYAPGVITSITLYLPFSVYAYVLFWNTGQLTLLEALSSGLLGILYQVVPVSYLALSSLERRV
jgi:hypothetical protein